MERSIVARATEILYALGEFRAGLSLIEIKILRLFHVHTSCPLTLRERALNPFYHSKVTHSSSINTPQTLFISTRSSISYTKLVQKPQIPPLENEDTTSSSLVLRHHTVVPHICCKLAGHASLPVSHLKRRRMAPRLQMFFLLNGLGKDLGPAFTRESGAGRFDELGMNEVGPAERSIT